MSEYSFDLYSKIVSICANLLVLGAVTLAMYMASLQPETHLSVFCAWFFGLLLPILAGAWLCKRILRQRYAVVEGVQASNGLTHVRLAEKM
ncbi:MAG: hypothetical protein RRY29_09960 [Desulfovibrionaceae bacterium]